MKDVDLSRFDRETIVLHFGTKENFISARTFSDSLTAFSEVASLSNALLDPNSEIEIVLEAISQGSFRATLRRRTTGIGGFLHRGVEPLFWSIIGGVILSHVGSTDPNIQIITTDDRVIVTVDDTRYIIPNNTADHIDVLMRNAEVRKNLSKTFGVIEKDPTVQDFGLTRS